MVAGVQGIMLESDTGRYLLLRCEPKGSAERTVHGLSRPNDIREFDWVYLYCSSFRTDLER